ncbi:hypothetical protein GCM10020331_043560 [Ectobacillus funiculus]
MITNACKKNGIMQNSLKRISSMYGILFTQMKEYIEDDPIIIAEGNGRKLRDVQGNEYWDGVSSIWLNVHGHRVQELDQAIRDQLDHIAHSTLLGMANIPAIFACGKANWVDAARACEGVLFRFRRHCC